MEEGRLLKINGGGDDDDDSPLENEDICQESRKQKKKIRDT